MPKPTTVDRASESKFSCPFCHWSVTLSPAMERDWTLDGTLPIKCPHDLARLVRVVIPLHSKP
jgi:hypothetical protein